jgi:hypothetical protein
MEVRKQASNGLWRIFGNSNEVLLHCVDASKLVSSTTRAYLVKGSK